MDVMNGFELYFNIITFACGVYALYTVIKLRRLGKLFPNQLLIPKDSKPESCLDEESYIEYVQPRLLVLSIILILVGGVCLADGQWNLTAKLLPQVENIGFYVSEGGIVLCIVALIWYMVCWTKARKLYWV